MSIVDWKWDFSTSPPTKLVLVRWEGAAPEDTTWEDWEQLWTSYDLEDKVFLPDGGDVNNLELNRPKIYSTRDLKAKVQEKFYEYLDVRGVNNELAVFLHEYMMNKDRIELLRWMDSLKSFMER
ncbi:hypothetical protein D0Y65_046595 [Glycine soja]|uniref:Uncharacterized protein n=1 Tax=Glycine soja TaxID=3848 RepID=A0A445GA40_GLYSO|nr:hypothetical protein D0Y65_046595 [Glycine soja]RZB58008.1 hypothetical protein D0Y65_046595 [Glycine soja]